MNNQEYEQEKRECWQEFTAMSLHKAFNFAFDRAYALGKKEKDAEETVISGWVAIDDDGDLFLYRTKPARDEVSGMWVSNECPLDVGISLFPDLTWDDEPIEVELIIKRKKK